MSSAYSSPGVFNYLFHTEWALYQDNVQPDTVNATINTIKVISGCLGVVVAVYAGAAAFLGTLSSLALGGLSLFSLSMFAGARTGSVGYLILPLLAYIGIMAASSSPALSSKFHIHNG